MRALATADLPPLAGETREADRTCEEVLRQQPCEGGAHLWICVRKDAIGTQQVLAALARAAVVPVEAVECAGHRDRNGRCLQWFSIPRKLVEHPGPLRRAGSHGRMQVTELTGGTRALAPELVERLRWRLTVRGGAAFQGYARARALLDRLRSVGMPSYLPPPRDHADGSLARWGRLLAHGRPMPARVRLARAKHGRCLRAFQELLYNRWLDARVRDGLLGRCLDGEMLRPRAGEDVLMARGADGQLRMDSWEAIPLGPLYGEGCVPAKGEAAARVAAELARSGVGAAALARLRGARRPCRAQPTRAQVDPAGEDVEITFELPVEAHIECLLDELLRPAPLRVAVPEDAVAEDAVAEDVVAEDAIAEDADADARPEDAADGAGA